MQVLGITPDYPYTVNINDGTRNRVMLGLVDGDYGIKIVDNAGNEIILANGTIIANAIKSGTLDCNLITVANLSASIITTGYLSATRISGGTLNCNLMTVTNLSANSITVGQFTSPNDRFIDETLSGVKITQNTIYGNRIVANSINADRIQAGTITADRITAKTITADRIQDYSLGTNQLQYNGVNGDRLVDATITNAKIANLSADKLNAGTIYVGYSGRPVAIYIARGSSGNSKFYFEGGSRMWADSSNRIGINSIGSPMYIYVNSSQRIVIPDSGQTSIYGGVYCDGNFNATGSARVNGAFYLHSDLEFQGEHHVRNLDGLVGYNDIRYVLGNNSYYHSFCDQSWNEHAWITSSGSLELDGNLVVHGSKSFRIEHPDDPENKYIQYNANESPEVAVKIRGRAKLAQGKATVTLPRHFELVSEASGLLTVQLTALDDCRGLYAPKSKLLNTSFEVKELSNGNSNAEFCWEVTAVRKGFKDFNPEPTKDEAIENRVKEIIEIEEANKEQKEKPIRRSEREMVKFKEIYKRIKKKDLAIREYHGLTLTLEDRQPIIDEIELKERRKK